MFAPCAERGFLRPTDADGAERRHREGGIPMSYEPEHHHDEPVVREPESGSGLVGYAAIKYVAIVAIVIAILVFLALYLIPALTD
jgi:hypothetical protein